MTLSNDGNYAKCSFFASKVLIELSEWLPFACLKRFEGTGTDG